jgi:FkbM family methyltransferase
MGQAAASLEAQLDGLLSEDIESVKERERSAFDAEVAPFGNSIVLFGVGNIGRKILARLREDGVEPLAFSDNNRAAWGTTVEGLPVLPPEEAARHFGATAAFLVSIYNFQHNFVDTQRQLQALGCRKVVSVIPLRWKFHETFLPFFRDDLPRRVLPQADAIRDALSIWADEASRREFVAQVEWRLRGNFDALGPPALGEQYFPDDLFELTPDESFVDAGAYDGDTLRTFLAQSGGAFREFLALEPDPGTFRALENYVATLPAEVRDRITIVPFAIGSSPGRVRFQAGSSTSSAVSESGTVEVECVRLDDLLSDRSPTYIKLDIEGAEPGALAGARRAIREDRPILAVCLYHAQDHLWRVPLSLRDDCQDYRFFLRPHRFECWETVCYAVPLERLGQARAGLRVASGASCSS